MQYQDYCITAFPPNYNQLCNIHSPELGPDDQNNLHHYSFKRLSQSASSPFSPANQSQQNSTQKEKQQITFFKSEQKQLQEDEEDHMMDINCSSDDESNYKKKHQQAKISPLNFQVPPFQLAKKDKPSYQIIIKRTLEEDAFEQLGQFNQQNGQEEDTQPQIQNLQTRTDSNMSSDQDLHTPGNKNWSKIRNVLKGIQLFSQCEVETISKPSDIAAHLTTSSKSISPHREHSPEVKKQNSGKAQEDCTTSELIKNLHKEAQQNAQREQIRLMDDFKYRKMFFEAIENGSPSDLVFIEEYLKDDPKKYLIVEESGDRRMNKSDTFGQTPMYCAAKNGNLEVLKIFTKYKANNKLISYLNNDQSASDTPLNVSSRWGHVNVVQYLLNTYNWDLKDIKDSYKSTTNKQIKKLLSQKM